MAHSGHSEGGSPVFVQNCTFTGNNAGAESEGGALYASNSNVMVRNSILWADSAGSGSEFYGYGATGDVQYCNIDQDGYAGSNGNIRQNPVFVRVGNYRLRPESPCIDAGTNIPRWGEFSGPALPPTDFEGEDRMFDGNDDGTVTIDMGADEYNGSSAVTPLYVKTNGSNDNDGMSWETAFQSIQYAINVASDLDEIWVKAGTYPVSGAIEVSKPVAIYGGFYGVETELSQRNWRDNVTAIEGGSGSYPCLYITADATVDGLTIQNGFNKGGGKEPGIAGGIHNDSCSPAIVNCTLSGNTSMVYGGGMYNYYSSPTISGCIFAGNGAEQGGGIYNYDSYPSIVNSVFCGNTASQYGGGIYENNSGSAITNCTFSGNGPEAWDGAGLYIDGSSATVITNCILWGNGPESGYEIGTEGGSESIAYSNIDQDGYAGTNGNIRQTPLFVDPGTGDLHLQSGSPCIDAGNNAASGLPEQDIDGDDRVIDGDSDTTATVDMGADEYLGSTYVDGDFDADGVPDILWRNGTTGSNAIWYLQSNGSNIKGVTGMPSCGISWSVGGVADFDGDAVPDILWRNPATGTNAVWYLQNDGSNIKTAGGMPSCGTTWRIAGVVDFDADGTPDIMWRNPSTGANVIWYLQSNGASIKSATGMPAYGTTWEVGGLADFDVDGTPDIMWRNQSTGVNALWYLQSDGTGIKTGGGMPSCGSVWQVGKIADFDADGVPDILWRNGSTGVNAIWYLQSNGSNIKGVTGMPSCGTAWEIGG